MPSKTEDIEAKYGVVINCTCLCPSSSEYSCVEERSVWNERRVRGRRLIRQDAGRGVENVKPRVHVLSRSLPI